MATGVSRAVVLFGVLGLVGSFLVGVASAPAFASPTITTETVDSSGDVGAEASLALDGSGNPVISYFDVTNGDLKLAVCDDPTCASATLQTVDSTGNVGADASLALDGSGNPVISYFDATNLDLKLAVCDDPTCASATLQTVDSTGHLGWDTSLVLDASGNPVISYFDVTNGDLKLAVCDDPTCASATLQTVDSTAQFVGRWTSLVLDASGNPVISYYDDTNGDLKLAVCDDPTCASATLQTVDSAGDVGRRTSLVLDASGNPVISYFDATNGDLELAVCDDSTCASATLQTVDSTGDVGVNTSLALDASGNPVIGYYDDTNGDLKLAVCDDPVCASATLHTVDSTGRVGVAPSLALDASGNPVIAYLDYLNGNLKLAKVDIGGGDSVDVAVSGAITYSNSGSLDSGDLTISRDANGAIMSVSGSGSIPGTAGGSTDVAISARRLLSNIFIGRIVIADPGVGINTNTPIFLQSVYPDGPDGARGQSTWFTFVPPFSFRTYRVEWHIQDLA